MRDFGLPPATDNAQRRQDVVIELLSDILDELRSAKAPTADEPVELTEPKRPGRKRSNG